MTPRIPRTFLVLVLLLSLNLLAHALTIPFVQSPRADSGVKLNIVNLLEAAFSNSPQNASTAALDTQLREKILGYLHHNDHRLEEDAVAIEQQIKARVSAVKALLDKLSNEILEIQKGLLSDDKTTSNVLEEIKTSVLPVINTVRSVLPKKSLSSPLGFNN